MKDTIFLVINSLNGGGAERVASRLSEEWDKEYNLVVISLSSFSQDDYQFFGKCISIDDSYSGQNWFGKIKKASKRIDNLAEEYNPIAIISFLQNANLCVAMTRYKTRKILSIRNYLSFQYRGYKRVIWSILIRRYFKNVDAVVSVSKLINDEMINKFGLPKEKCFYIYNPYNVQEIKKAAQENLNDFETEFFNKYKVIVNVGHISQQKGQFHLVRVLKYLKEECFAVAIIGKKDSDYAKKIMDLATEYGVSERVLLLGAKENPYKYIKKGFCFVFPSKYEGFPNALVEAMACGIPVISTDCKSGPSEILLDEYGILVKSCDDVWIDSSQEPNCTENDIISAIKKLMVDDEYYRHMSEEASKRAGYFSTKKICKQWKQIIHKEI